MGQIVVYNKLVRDDIPKIIEASGKTPVTRVLDDRDFKIYVHKKLDEEVKEFQENPSVEELADIVEVIVALCEAYGYTFDQVLSKRFDKAISHGVFKNRTLLIEVVEGDNET